jgi:hypothetical protein
MFYGMTVVLWKNKMNKRIIKQRFGVFDFLAAIVYTLSANQMLFAKINLGEKNGGLFISWLYC